MPVWSDHALARWAERFPNSDPEFEFARAKRVGRKTKAAIKAHCPGNAHWMQGGFKGRYFLMTKDRLVFVLHAPDTVVTVFTLAVNCKQ